MKQLIDNLWEIVGAILLLGACGLGLAFVVAEKKVDGYYLSQGNSRNAIVCVYSHWTWHVDELSYCTDDKDKALDFVAKANASLQSAAGR